jgi:formylglycine-generating enzyme required for sulfatase activity
MSIVTKSYQPIRKAMLPNCSDAKRRSLPRAVLMALWLGIAVLLASVPLYANNITVSNTRLVGQNAGDGSVMIQFDLSWKNSWRVPLTSGINNWDAAWVFVKWRVPVSVGGDGLWKHVRLNNSGHTAGTGMTVETGLLTPGTTYDATTNPALGVFIYRSEPGRGDINLTGVQLVWDYSAAGLSETALLEVQVFAIEMVYVPQGSFFVGSGGTEESGSFTDGAWTSGATIPFQITSENALSIAASAGDLRGTSSSGNSTIGGAGTLPAAYPKGFKAFYSMKYSISQQQYVDFLNTLTRVQQEARFASTTVGNFMHSGATQTTPADRNGVKLMEDPGGSTPRVFGCDLNNNNTAGEANDGQWIAINFISWMDGAAYMDWAGLRPMTELEFEKAARGFAAPVANEYAWGTASIANAAYTLSNPGEANESIATNYNTTGTAGNAIYSSTSQLTIDGPVRVGIFAANAGNTGRVTSGASYWGIMELSGNLWERPVTVGNNEGRAFTGLHGDGALSANGHANVTVWPGLVSGEITGATGSGFRGGGWSVPVGYLRVSNRVIAALTSTGRSTSSGFRGVRTAGCVNDASAPTIDTSGGLSPSQASAGQLLTYKVTGAGSHLWVVPNNWQIVSGQGTNQITVIIGATLPGTVRVAAVDACGAGAETAIQIGQQ